MTWRRCWRPNWASPRPYRVTVRTGSYTTGPRDPVDRRLATVLARGVPGVLQVRFDEE